MESKRIRLAHRTRLHETVFTCFLQSRALARDVVFHLHHIRPPSFGKEEEEWQDGIDLSKFALFDEKTAVRRSFVTVVRRVITTA